MRVLFLVAFALICSSEYSFAGDSHQREAGQLNSTRDSMQEGATPGPGHQADFQELQDGFSQALMAGHGHGNRSTSISEEEARRLIEDFSSDCEDFGDKIICHFD